MSDDLRARLHGLVEAEGRASSAGPDESAALARRVRSRRRSRAWAAAALVIAVLAIGAALSIGVLGAASGWWGEWGAPDVEPESTIETIVGFAPASPGLTVELDGTVIPADAAYRDSIAQIQPVGCAALDEYGVAVRQEDVWASTADIVVRTGSVSALEGGGMARITARWFVNGDAQGFVDDFAALAARCEPGFAGLGDAAAGDAPSGLGAVDSVESAAVDVPGATAHAVRALITLEDGDRLDLYLFGAGEAAVAVAAGPASDRAAGDGPDVLASAVLEQFQAQVLDRIADPDE
ncbi:hypothetical protein [Demequina sp. NBRC 110053]|uniref:hypothetical protein n=1 Tax=Demequina sp. NBRC 110053 TaxID=1570342 RepID=UPI000A064609|nr:hypothetical protein [Demequina sp. NBRC 110053]